LSAAAEAAADGDAAIALSEGATAGPPASLRTGEAVDVAVAVVAARERVAD
jgi:hypothetical protein